MVYLHANYEGLTDGVSYQSHMPHIVYRLVYQDLIVPTSFGNLCNCELLNRKACECRGPIGYASDCCLNCGREKCTDVLICTSNNVPSNFPDDDVYLGECRRSDRIKVFHCDVPVMDLEVVEECCLEQPIPSMIVRRGTIGLLIVHQRIRDLVPGRPIEWRDVSLAFPMTLGRPPEVRSDQSNDLDPLLGCESH